MQTDGEDAAIVAVRETVGRIRFALNQLNSQNAHHHFEDLARYLARETVSRNLLPATGPVAAGGDQGRDFETFKTDLVSPAALGEAIGLKRGDPVAFACTLQSSGLRTKILEDTKAIAESGSPVNHVVYYCEANVPVAVRHKLQEELREGFGLHLEIFDGQAIAELLGQWQHYWIAEQFLNLPADARPAPPARAEWYEADLQRWRSVTAAEQTIGSLTDLVGCLRHAVSEPEARDDLPFWMERVEQFVHEGVPQPLVHKARYELVAAQLRGLGDLHPAEPLATALVERAARDGSPTEVVDAAVVVLYCAGARVRGLTEISEHTLLSWNHALQRRCEELLQSAAYPGERCTLLDTLGWLRAQPDLVAARERGFRFDLEDIPKMSDLEWQEAIATGEFEPVDRPVIDVEGAFDAWMQLLDVLPEAPLYPVERSAQMLRISAHVLTSDARFDEVVVALDKRVADVEGRAAAAANARDRAMGYYEREELLPALRDMHRARQGWFSGEMSRGLVLATMMTSRIYARLDLLQAAKHYALVAARLVQEEDLDLYPQALFQAASADYHQGAWASASRLLAMAFRAHWLLAEEPDDPSRHEALQYGMLEASIIQGGAALAGPAFQELVAPIVETGIDSLIDAVLESLSSPPWWTEISPEEFAARTADELGHYAFSDCGARRSIQWAALGCEWSVDFANDTVATVVGERVAAVLQVVAADLGLRDPCLLPSSVAISLEIDDELDLAAVDVRADGCGSQVRVRLSSVITDDRSTHEARSNDALIVAWTVLAELSVLNEDALAELMDATYSGGLMDHVVPGVTFDWAHRDVLTGADFGPMRECEPLFVPGVTLRRSPDLSPDGMAPGVTKAELEERVRYRYDSIPRLIPHTLSALRAFPPFLGVVEELRGEGWLDWHILLAVMQVAQNARFRDELAKTPLDAPEDLARVRDLMMSAEEEPGDAADVELFTRASLEQHLTLALASSLGTHGFRLRQNPPDIAAVRELMGTRLLYWDLDVDHSDPFFLPLLGA